MPAEGTGLGGEYFRTARPTRALLESESEFASEVVLLVVVVVVGGGADAGAGAAAAAVSG